MKKIPQVLIIGRPNVGKSTLINRVLGVRKSITAPEPGVTRDVLARPITWNCMDFLLMDTGGIFFSKTKDFFQAKIEKSVQTALQKAQKIVFLTDYREGVQPLDKHIASMLQPYAIKVVVAVNKIDDPGDRQDINNFRSLGFGTPFPVSAVHGNGLGDLLDEMIKGFPKQELANVEEFYQKLTHISIIGRPNVGKSSFLNAMINEERAIVDEKAGTTRDAIDVYFSNGQEEYLFIDTAGISKKIKFAQGVDFFSFVRTKQTIINSDLVIIILEAPNFLVDQDKKLIREVIKNKKNFLLFVNKWDLVERTDQNRQLLEKKARDLYPQLEHYPIIFGSALEKSNLHTIFKTIPQILDVANQRITTPQLNQFIEKVVRKNSPPSKYGQQVKIYYATQVSTSPFLFVFFVNNPALVKEDYKRFLEKRMRAYFGGFEGCTLVLEFRGKENRKH